MDKLQTMIDKMPKLSDSRMVTNGFCVWVICRGDLNPAIPQTLTDYGGMLVTEDRGQSLWFFFSTDVILALARLEVWARFNPLPVFTQVIPAKLLLGLKLEVTATMGASLANQEASPSSELEVWVHPKVRKLVATLPGIEFEKTQTITGLANVDWMLLQADPRLPYQSSLGWYGILKPLGNPLDKKFLAGWREFFAELELIMKQMKLKFVIHDFFVIFPLESLRQLRLWCKEFLVLVRDLKATQPEKYWPCVMAMVDSKGLNFNAELPKKVRLDWEQLVPDFPHLSYRTAFLLGDGFKINDVRFSVDSANFEDWSNVALAEDFDENVGALQVELPARLVTGQETHCFYCGLRSHNMTECPSRQLRELRLDIWDKIANLDFEVMSSALSDVDKTLADDPEGGLNLLLTGGGADRLLMQALFEINVPAQLRMMLISWRSTAKDYPRALVQLAPPDSGGHWEGMNLMLEGELVQADRALAQTELKNPRDYKCRTIHGFVAMERGDPGKALALWQECEMMSPTPFLQAYHLYLQGRCMEVQGRLQQASTLYKQASMVSTRWFDTIYRQGVCLVKMGFAEQAMGFFEDLFARDSNMFNRVLIDAELERGHLHLLNSLYSPWIEAENRAKEESLALNDLHRDVGKWFPEDHPFTKEVWERSEQLEELAQIKNFVAYARVVQGRKQLNIDFQERIELEGKRLRERYINGMEKLRVIEGEASWFPFPRLLTEFNKDFNFCARNLNWAMKQPFQTAENFLRASALADKIDKHMENLETKMKTLKIVRDSTLFVLILGKAFFWIELIGITLAAILMPIGYFLGIQQGMDWIEMMTFQEKMDVVRGVIIILSVSALAISALRAALVFESRKDKLFRRYEQYE